MLAKNLSKNLITHEHSFRGDYSLLVFLSLSIIRGESVLPYKITRRREVLDSSSTSKPLGHSSLCQNNIYNHSETLLTECGIEKTFKRHLWPWALSYLIWLTGDECKYAESTGHFPERCHCEVMWWQSRVVGRHPLTPELNKQKRFRMKTCNLLEWMTDRSWSTMSWKMCVFHCCWSSNTSSNT